MNKEELKLIQAELIRHAIDTESGDRALDIVERELKKFGTKKFRATATMSTKLVLDIDADDIDEAWRIARETDGGQFTALPDGDWEIYDVTEAE